jgi:O-antigen ligase
MFINWGELSYKRLFFFFDMHPSYYALFSIIVIIILIFTHTIKLKKLLKWSFILIHMIMIIFLSSKTGIISLFIVLLAYLFIGQSKKNRLIGVAVVLLLALIIIKTPSTEVRLESAYKSLNSEGNLLHMNSTSERLMIWNSLADLSLKELVVGVGNTGGRDRIVTNTGIDKNMHNQFLQSLLSAGFIGFSLITIFVFLPLFFKRNIFTISLVLIVFVNLLFENMLDRIWGITAISFFYAFIIFGSAEMLNFKSAKN